MVAIVSLLLLLGAVITLLILAFIAKENFTGVMLSIFSVILTFSLVLFIAKTKTYNVVATGTLQTPSGKYQVYIIEDESITYVIEKEEDMHWQRGEAIELSNAKLCDYHIIRKISKYNTLDDIEVKN